MMIKYIKKLVCLSLVFLCTGVANAQYKKISYTSSQEDIPNPERGFYLAAGEKPGELSVTELKKLRTVYSSKSPNANYSTWISLVYRGYMLTDFRNGAISDEFLSKLQKDFDTVREAGLKIVLRFSYIDKTTEGNCPDKAICPPYGDAPKNVVLQHIEQLKPFLQKNADVIAVMQQGFIGIWGENHYTDYFGDPSKNGPGYIPDSSWTDRNEMLKALLDALPKERMVQVRTPQLQQRFIFGAKAALITKPSLSKKAFDLSDASRVAFHNDCFLASPDDYETFSDYGNSSGRTKVANEVLRKYFEAESKYLAVGGETCDDAFSPQNDCAPYGYAMKEMANMHYSFLNVSYNNLVNNDWEEQGCMSDIKKKLGYRFYLKETSLPEVVKSGRKLKFSLQLENQGFASPYNPRPVQLVLRNSKDGSIYKLTLKTNIQKWYSGQISINESVKIPKNIKANEYELLLTMPDGYPNLQDRPEYSIRLANNGLWEKETGYNKLNAKLIVR